MEAQQDAYAGEEVSFDFVLTDWLGSRVSAFGWADYAAATYGSHRIEVEPDSSGRFQFKARLDGEKPGGELIVRTAAYRQQGDRDFMEVDGKWLGRMSPSDMRDAEIAADSIRFHIYQTPVDLDIAKPSVALEPDTGVLRFYLNDGTSQPVYVDRPNRRGFVVEGPAEDGHYHIHYLPSANEVNRTGRTRVRFEMYDLNGTSYEAETVLETP